jgi:branched-chain amino acid aminotransferase
MPPIPEDLFVDGTAELVRLDHGWVPSTAGASLYIRPVCFATEPTLAVRPSSTYLFVVLTCPVGPYFADPLRLIVEERYVRAFPKGTGAIKAAGNYAGSLVAQRLAQEQGFHSVVWLDGPNGRFVEESGLMNVCFVIDGAVVTPPLGGTILPGVTRDSAIVLLRDMNIEVVERPIAIDEVLHAGKTGELSEAFALGTAAAVAPIESIRYRDDDLRLNVQADRSVAAKLRTRLEGIRTGREPDRYGWLTRL